MALLMPDVTGQGDDLLQEEPINSSLPCTGLRATLQMFNLVSPPTFPLQAALTNIHLRA